MGDKISLRGLLFMMAVSAIIFMVIRLALIYQGQNGVAAVAVMIFVPIVTFALFGVAFLFLLPFGIIAALSRESSMPGTSPFAEGNLPRQQIDTIDPDRAN
jgi:hypothetical protein